MWAKSHWVGVGLSEGQVLEDDVEAHMWLTIAASRSTGAERELIVTARDAGAARMNRRQTCARRNASRRRGTRFVLRAPGHEEPCRAAQRHGPRGLDYRCLIGRFGANVEKRLAILRAF